MEALQQFQQYERFLRSICKVLGFDVLSRDWRKTFRTYLSIFLISLYCFCMMYSIVIAVDTFELLKSLAFLGFFFQCSIKVYYTIAKSHMYSTSFEGLQSAIYTDHLGGTEQQRAVITRIIRLVLILTRTTTVLYTSSLFIFSLYPAYMYFVVDVKVTIFPLYVPGIDIYSAYGYGITNSMHMVFAVYGLLGAVTSDTAFMMYVLHIVTYAELFEIECERFSQDLSDACQQWEPHLVEYGQFCRDRMRSLYGFHQNMIAYIERVTQCYEGICVVEVATCSFSIMFNLFLALTTDWYATYSFLVVSWFQLFIYSLLGTVMQTTIDRLNTEVTRLPWYMLPNDEQQRFWFMLTRSQMPGEITIRSVGPLNMETFTNIMQKIYSAFTMMYSFLDDLS
ncbi:putative odorant receptor 83c [Anopheles nili]|uniref:putative odorant receptor 83c n=1 Tax=Anopheles nili TaxID=185578 RepID=UPI00237BA727|nr:putative odorant receptor 83c [Anopheles nili]